MNIIANNIKTNYQEYKNLLLLRDDYKHKAFQYHQEYLRVFGKLVKEIFMLKIECITLRKKITYCQQKINRNEPIFNHDLDNYIETIMSDYYQQLEELRQSIDGAANATVISQEDVKRIKHIYRRIAKLIHPDMNPKLYQKPEIKDLWERTVVAYNCNDLKELQEIEILVSEYSDSNGEEIVIENIEEKIEQLQNEIAKIKETNPYLYKFILEDDKLIIEHKEELNNEKDEYSEYKKQLETIFANFNIEELVN